MDLLEEGMEILQQKNTKLCNGAVERRAKKKNRWVVLFTKLVLITESARALITAKAAIAETKQQVKDTRKHLKKNKSNAAIIAQAQVQEKKEAYIVTKVAKGVAG